MQDKNQLEQASVEVEAALSVLIELMLAESDSKNEDVAMLLMRVRALCRQSFERLVS